MESIKLDKYNIILLECGIYTKNLWDNSVQKKVFLKNLYSYALANNFSNNYIEKFSAKLGIERDLYIDLLREYINDLPVESRPNIKMKNGKYIIQKKEKGMMEKLYDELYSLKSLNEIKDFFRKNEIYKNKLLNEFYRFKNLYTDADAEIIMNNINMYKQYMHDLEQEKFANLGRMFNSSKNKNNNVKSAIEIEKESEEKRKKALEVVNLVVNSKTNHICHLLEENNISKYDFKKYLSTIKEDDKSLYRKFSLKMTKIVSLVLQKMNNPIIENGVQQPFDIIDYLLITDIEPNELSSFVSKSSSMLLKKFYSKNLFSFKNEEKFKEYVMKELVLFDAQNAKFDDKGNYIEGTARKLSDDEKLNLIKYLDDNKIYKNKFTYSALKNRYRKGFELNKTKKLTKLNRTN